MTVPQESVRTALEKRKHYILENLESVTMKKLRATLEDDLSLKPDELKPFKQLIANYVDTLMTKQEKGEADAKQAKNRENEPMNVRSKTKSASSSSAPRTFSKKVNQQRSLCRLATIPIPPSVYAKNKTDEELAAALEALLEKHGLSASSNSQDAAKIKAKLQLQRDLDGIDTSNIISEGRRNRRGNPKANYRYVAQFSALSSLPIGQVVKALPMCCFAEQCSKSKITTTKMTNHKARIWRRSRREKSGMKNMIVTTVRMRRRQLRSWRNLHRRMILKEKRWFLPNIMRGMLIGTVRAMS